MTLQAGSEAGPTPVDASLRARPLLDMIAARNEFARLSILLAIRALSCPIPSWPLFIA